MQTGRRAAEAAAGAAAANGGTASSAKGDEVVQSSTAAPKRFIKQQVADSQHVLCCTWQCRILHPAAVHRQTQRQVQEHPSCMVLAVVSTLLLCSRCRTTSCMTRRSMRQYHSCRPTTTLRCVAVKALHVAPQRQESAYTKAFSSTCTFSDLHAARIASRRAATAAMHGAAAAGVSEHYANSPTFVAPRSTRRWRASGSWAPAAWRCNSLRAS